MASSHRMLSSAPSIISRASLRSQPQPREFFRLCRRGYAERSNEPTSQPQRVQLLSEVDAKGRPIQGAARTPSKFGGIFAPKTRLTFGVVFLGILIWDMMTNKVAPEESEEQLEAVTVAERDALTKRESGITASSPMRLRMEALVKEYQNIIVEELEKIDGKKFKRDEWTRPHGGGGISCVLQEGNVFEKAGVNISVVYGTLPRAAIQQMRVNHKAMDPDVDSLPFFASGLSLVLHPKNPMAPTVHFNYRYFETENPDGSVQTSWFGGGCDLTPSYLFDEDAIHFHRTLKEACDKHDKSYYPRFKKWCDEYFFVKHRGETRGVGGIFFDDMDDTEKDQESLFSFIKECLSSFLPAYLPILERRIEMPYTEKEKSWQQLRRGRYVEFNLVHDRGTSFGLNTPGARVESILMSLPLTARWQYMHEPEKGGREERLLEVLRKPVEWL